jgi:cytoskeletal protein RodZ
LGDSSQVSEDLMEKKDLDKRVRARTTLTKDHEIADLAARYFDSEHPLPAICLLSLVTFFYFVIVFLVTLGLFSFQDHQSLVSRPPLSEGGAIQDVPISAASEAPEAEDSQDEDEGEDSLERTSSTTSPPPALSEDLGIDKKRKCVEELASSSASAHKNVAREASALEDEEELFDALYS